MSSPIERLGRYRDDLKNSPETQHSIIGQTAQIQSAIEVCEALAGLTFAVNDMANRAVAVANNLQKAVERATEQAERTAQQSTGAAKESAKVSRQLNRLTLWIIAAAILSAIAACVQAGTTIYTSIHPPN